MLERDGAMLLAAVAVLTMGVRVVEAAPGDPEAIQRVGLTQYHVTEAAQLTDWARMRGTVASQAGLLVVAQGGAVDQTTQEQKKTEETPLQQRSKKLRDDIAKIIADEGGKKKLPETAEEVKKLPGFTERVTAEVERKAERKAVTAAQREAAPRLMSQKERQEEIEKAVQEEAKRIAAENAEKNANAERAERALVAPTSSPATLEEDTESAKERAFQNYESEKASGTLRELLDTVR